MTKEDAERHLKVGIRIYKHGYINWGFLPGITIEMLEQFADEIDLKYPENKWEDNEHI